MKKQSAISRMGLKVALAYRFGFLVSLVTAPVTLMIYYFLWKSIFTYAGTEVIKGFTFPQMVTYYVIGLLVAFFTWSEVDRWMEHDIVKGEAIQFFQRPVSVLAQYYYFELGINILGIVVEAIPLYLIGIFFFGLQKATAINLVLFIIMLAIASATYFIISFLIGLLAFWMNRINGISKAKKPILALLSGALLPLTFYPDWFQSISVYLPFQYLRFIPINVFLGKYEIGKIIMMFGIQLAWLALFITVAKLIEKKAFKKFAGSGT